jgi:hypothetical protein
LLFVLMVAGWILVAVVCAVVLGKAVRSAEARERPAPIIPETLPMPSQAEELGFVQICLFDATVQPEPVPVS